MNIKHFKNKKNSFQLLCIVTWIRELSTNHAVWKLLFKLNAYILKILNKGGYIWFSFALK